MAATLDDIIRAIEKGFDKAARKKGTSTGAGASGTGAAGAPGSGPPTTADPAAALQAELDLLTKYEEKLKGLGNTEVGRAAQAQQALLIAEKKLEIAQKEVKAADEMTPKMAKRLADEQKAVDLAGEKADKLEEAGQKIQEEIDLMRDFGKEAANSLLPFEKSKFFNVAAMGKFWDVMSSGAAATAAGMISFGVGLLENLIGGIIDAIFALDEMESGMMKATGMSRKMARQFADASDDVSHLWISTEEYSKAAIGLYGTMTDFTMLLPETQNQLAATTSVLSKWGVSAQEVGKSFQFATKMMGQLPAEADKVALEMASFAMNVGVPVDQMMSDFNAMAPQLAKLGDEAPRAFKEMARVAKITGMEIGKLLNLTDKFDTFEGAAEMTGQLNAALGGNFVNAMDMMMETDPVGRFEQLRGALDDAGLTFDDMSYYQRKFFAESMGLESVGDLALMMSGNMDDLAGETNKTAAEYEEMAQKAAEQASIQEKFQGFLDDIMRTLVDSGMLDKIHQLFDEFSRDPDGDGTLAKFKKLIVSIVEDTIPKIIKGIDIIKELWPEIVKWTKIFISLKLAQGIVYLTSTLFTAIGAMYSWITAKGGMVMAAHAWIVSQLETIYLKWLDVTATNAGTLATMGAIAKTVLMLPILAAQAVGLGIVTAAKWAYAAATTAAGLASMAMVIGILLVAGAIYLLVDAFLISSPSLLVIAVLGLAFALWGLVPVMTAMTPILWSMVVPLLGVGAAILMMGAAVYLAAMGMTMFVGSLSQIDATSLLATAMALYSLGLALVMVAGGLAMMGNPVTAAGVVVFTGFIYGLAAAMAGLAISLALVVFPLIALFDTLEDMKHLATVASSMSAIVDAINDVSLAKALALGTININSGGGGFGARGGGGGGGGPQKITIQLDKAQTKSFFEGLVTEVQGKNAGSGAGTR